MTTNKIIVGIDEVGRGCLAGPLVAAAVVLDSPIMGLKDSKQLSRHSREKLAELVTLSAVFIGIGWADVDELNRYGLTKSVSIAMKRALAKINAVYHDVIIDGNYNYLSGQKNTRVLIKADQFIPSVSAASIVAKVYRDKWMAKLSNDFPEYGFDKHVGYGTKYHLAMIELYGPCKLHRMLYKPLQKYTANL